MLLIKLINIINYILINYNSLYLQESLHLSLVKRNNSETKNLRRSLKIPPNEMHSEKENTSPGIFKRKSLISSPKPIETPSKRKSIKRSMSCHGENKIFNI